MKLIAHLLIFFGVLALLFSGVLFYQRYNPDRLAFADTSEFGNAALNSEVFPISIAIENVGIDVPLHPAEITGTTWSDTKEGASYLTSSPLPGTSGNSIIYGHNYPVIFGSLTKVIPGDIIKVGFSDGSTAEFEVLYTTTVPSSQTGVLAQTEDARLTVYTCTGFLDSKRFVVTAVKK